MSATENRSHSGRFAPGKSGNPGGRPKGLRSRVREEVGEQDLVKFAAAVFYGDTADLSAWNVVPADITLRDRQWAHGYLSDQGYGKAPSFAPVEDGDPLELNNTEQIIETLMDELAPKREAAASRKTA